MGGKHKDICDKSMTIDDCELAIVRMAVDKAEERAGRKTVNSPEVKKIIDIVETFLRKKKLVAYGGTAINAILPKKDQFYNKDLELPDYDFFSPEALNDAKELCDEYVKQGFSEVEGKAGVHEGTYKVYVNFIPVADVTFLHQGIFDIIQRDAVKVSGILYAPPNYLRMSMYLELSRPQGDVSRWEKVLKRLVLLNKNYPLKADHCNRVAFQRHMEDISKEKLIFNSVKHTFLDEQVVFFGGYAMSLYSKYMPRRQRKRFKRYADFDVLAEDPKKVATIVKKQLEEEYIDDVTIVKHDAIGEIVSPHYEIKVGEDTIAFIYKPIACHSYNQIEDDGYKVNIATIDTMLSYYLAFLYAGREYYDVNRILCISQYLFRVQLQNRLKQKGLLKRFTIRCYGKQATMQDIKEEKSKQFEKMKKKKGTKEYETLFFRYRPGDRHKSKTKRSRSSSSSSKTRKNK